MRDIKVIINEVIIKDTYSEDQKLISKVEMEEELDEVIPSAIIECFKKIYDVFTPSQNQTVEIWSGETPKRVFYGSIIDIKSEGALVKIQALMETQKLLRKRINKVYMGE